MERDTLAYQEQAISHLRKAVTNYGYGFLNMTMRGRKTRTVLHTIERLGGDKVLIICPPAVKETWESEIKAMEMDYLERHIVSRDILSYKSTDHKFDWLIVDEIHDFRDWSKRSKSLYKIAKNCKKRIGLTGTPFNNSILEYFYPLKILSHGKFCKFKYSTNADKWNKYWGYTDNPMSDYPTYLLKLEKQEEFYKLLLEVAFILDPKRVRPPKLKPLWYQLTEEQKTLISDLRRGRDVKFATRTLPPVGELVHRNNAEAQICSGFMYTKKGTNIITVYCRSQKWEVLRDLLNRLEGRCVLWYNYTAEKEDLLALVPEAKVFKPGKKMTVYPARLIAHPKSAGAGIDLSSYDYSIYVSLTNSYVSHRQSEFRIADQEKTIKTNYVLCCRDTVEEARLRKLYNREREHIEFYLRGDKDEVYMDK